MRLAEISSFYTEYSPCFEVLNYVVLLGSLSPVLPTLTMAGK